MVLTCCLIILKGNASCAEVLKVQKEKEKVEQGKDIDGDWEMESMYKRV